MDGVKKFFERWAKGFWMLLIMATVVTLPLVLLGIVGSVLSILLSLFNWEMILLAIGVSLALLGVPSLLGYLVEEDNSQQLKLRDKKMVGIKPKPKKNKRG